MAFMDGGEMPVMIVYYGVVPDPVNRQPRLGRLAGGVAYAGFPEMVQIAERREGPGGAGIRRSPELTKPVVTPAVHQGDGCLRIMAWVCLRCCSGRPENL
jgi:hypothetical protein